MCGPSQHSSARPRAGALAALGSPSPSTSSSVCSSSPPSSPSPLRADLAFHAPGRTTCSQATHARLTPRDGRDWHQLRHLRVVIHRSGDLTKSASDCGLFHQFDIPASLSSHPDAFIELSLRQPLPLHVGDEGIIGRRVSLCSRPDQGADVVLAEGIVGFNQLDT